MEQEREMEEMLLQASYDRVRQNLLDNRFWLKVFVRPCCAKPDERGARIKTEGLRSILGRRNDFSDEQQQELSRLVDEGASWYLSRFC